MILFVSLLSGFRVAYFADSSRLRFLDSRAFPYKGVDEQVGRLRHPSWSPQPSTPKTSLKVSTFWDRRRLALRSELDGS